MLRTRFPSPEDFWGFHRLFEEKSFLDTVEDERLHNYERVRILVQKYMFEKQIEDIQIVLTVRKIRREFFETCMQDTGLSERKIENILKTECKGVRPSFVKNRLLQARMSCSSLPLLHLHFPKNCFRLVLY